MLRKAAKVETEGFKEMITFNSGSARKRQVHGRGDAQLSDGGDGERGAERLHHDAGQLRQGPRDHLHQDPQQHQPAEPEARLGLHRHHGPAHRPGGSRVPQLLQGCPRQEQDAEQQGHLQEVSLS